MVRPSLIDQPFGITFVELLFLLLSQTKQDDDEVRLLASLHKYSLISCRLDALVKALNQCVKSKIKAVIFCYDMLLRNSIESMLKHLKFMFLTFVGRLHLVIRLCSANSINISRLEGATNVQQATVDKFNETPLITALLVCAPQVSVQSIHIKSKTEVFVVDAPLWPPDTFPPHFSVRYLA
jgi:SNF2 family DNA or RNA helicase